AAARKRDRAQRVRRRDVDRARDLETRCNAVYDEGDEASISALGPAAEDDVMAGDTGVRDPGLFAVDHDGVAVAPGRRLNSRDVGAGIGLRDGKGRDGRTGGDTGKVLALQRFRSEERDRSGPKPLHGEGELGQ